MASKKDYTKEIIEEYNNRLQLWGPSDTWGLAEFKMLEDLICESSKMRINANTLKRFFRQRTSTPQIATYNALCIFLGYSGYTDFVMKKTSAERERSQDAAKKDSAETTIEESSAPELSLPSEPDIVPQKSSFAGQGVITPGQPFVKRHKKLLRFLLFLSIAGLILLISWDKINEKYIDYLIVQITFKASVSKGTSPLTVKFEYEIPSRLMNNIYIVFKEANGDTIQKRPGKNQKEIYMTYIYPGKGSCTLMYGNKIIKTIDVETRTPGWSVYVRDDKKDFFDTIPFDSIVSENGYITVPIEKVPKEAVTDKLFVSYTYYNSGIADGNNFICEARVRNSAQDHGIPCYDVMMYVFSNTEMHGFALNRNCYSYLKFISGENAIMGDKYDLSDIDFNPADWHIMRIEVIDKKTTFYLDGKTVLNMAYNCDFGKINEITLRFKGCGAINYVKILKPNGEMIYHTDFG